MYVDIPTLYGYCSFQAVAIQCLHGTGRTGTVLACLYVRRFKYTPEVAIDKAQTILSGSFESKQQEDRVLEFWEREKASHWMFEIEVWDDSDSSENEAWFIEEEIGDWTEEYDGGIDVLEVEDDTDDDDIVVYDHHNYKTADDNDDIIEEINESTLVVESSDSDSSLVDELSF